MQGSPLDPTKVKSLLYTLKSSCWLKIKNTSLILSFIFIFNHLSSIIYSHLTSERVENEKIISQIVWVSKVCVSVT